MALDHLRDAHNVPQPAPAHRPSGRLAAANTHVFRHSLATVLRDRCYDASIIAKVRGPTDEVFTRRVYIHTGDAPRFDDLDVPTG